MRHLRFEMRAMAGYGALVLLLAGGMALSLRGFAAMSDAQVARLRGEERAISLVERLRWNSELIESDGRGYLLSADARLVEDVEAASRRFDEHVRALHASDLSPEGTALIGEVEEAAAGFRRVQEELFAARRAAASPGPLVERFETELLPRRDALDRALARLVEHKEAKLLSAYAEARAVRDDVETRMYALLAALVLIAVLLALFFSRRLGRAYREARAALETARRAVFARDQLMGMVAHDLRTPLNAVMMNAELLQASDDPVRMRKRAASIARVSRRMEHLVESMLDMATLEAGRFTVTPAPQPVDELLRDATDELIPQAAAKQVALERDADVGDAAVCADRERVVQVLSNLVGNAVKFTPPGGTVTVEAHQEPDTVHFTVSDTGPGIGADDLPHVFDRFWKRERAAHGSGLGLFIAKGIVEAHDGRIWAESVAGQGARFHFTLPVAALTDTDRESTCAR